MGLTVIPGQCPPRRHGDVHRDSSGQPGLTRRTPDLPAPGTGVSQQRSQLNGHTTRDIRRSNARQPGRQRGRAMPCPNGRSACRARTGPRRRRKCSRMTRSWCGQAAGGHLPRSGLSAGLHSAGRCGSGGSTCCRPGSMTCRYRAAIGYGLGRPMSHPDSAAVRCHNRRLAGYRWHRQPSARLMSTAFTHRSVNALHAELMDRRSRAEGLPAYTGQPLRAAGLSGC